MFGKIKSGWSIVADSIGDAARVVVDKAGDAYDATASGLSSAGSIVADVANSAKDAISDTARTVTDKASEAYDVTSNGLSSAGSVVTEAAIDAKDVVGGAASSAYESTRGYAGALVSGGKDVPWGKVMLGASVGVAAIVVAPLTGGGSMLAVAGAAGLAGKALGGKPKDNAREEGYRQGAIDAKAEQQLVLTHLEQSLEAALNGLKGAAAHYDAIIAMHAVAVATANCDGYICDSERENIEMFIAGAATSAIPPQVSTKLQSLYDDPPSIRDAFELAIKSGIDMSVFDEIIQVVIHADGVQHMQEDAFMQAWNILKAG